MDKLLLNLIITVASTAYQISQNNKMKREADKRKGFNLTISGQAVSVPVAYGKNSLGGIEVKHLVRGSYTSATNNASKTFSESFANTSKSGSKNEYLTVQYALCHEGIEGVQWVKVDGIDYNDSSKKFNHIIRTHNNGGAADAIATANTIDPNNKFTNTAHASATFKLNRNDYNYNGIPQMEFLVKGRKVKWVKELNGVYSLSTDRVYSNNPALCLLDYLMNSKFGRGLSVNEVDLESFYNSAAVCDTIVATERTVAGQVNGQKTVHTVADNGSRPTNLEKHTYENELWLTQGSGKYWYWNKTVWVETTLTSTRPIPLYECNLTLDTEDNIRNNIERIMNTMGLAELTWSSEGKYKLLLEHPKTAIELSNLVDANHHFTDNDIIRDESSLSWPSASSRLNQATISFLNEHEDFKEDTITWPPSFSAAHTAYLTEDNNQPFQANIDADGITDPYHALAMAEQAVRKARSIFTLTFTVSKKGLNLEPGDFIKVTSDNLNISNEVFRVESIEVRGDFTVGLTCYKFDHEILAWNVEDDIAYATQPVFDFSVGAPTNGTFTQGAEDNLGTSSGRLSWTESDDIAVIDYLVEVSRDNKVTYQTLGVTRSTTFDVTGLKTGAYDFSIRGRTPLGGLSDRLEVDDETILLKTVGQVAVIYANTSNALTNTQSYNVGTNNFIAYYPYTSDLPTLPIRTGISFSKFIPEKEVDYFDGINGISVKLQYSVLGTGSWHDTFEANDKYVRSGTLTPPATTYVYGAAAKFVPELGVEYDDGIDGTNAYLHIAYADTSVGGGFSQSPTGKNYIGTYSDSNPVDSNTPGDYAWVLTKGATGVTGASTNIIFQRLATQPATPAASSGIPTGWYDNPPAGTELVWASSGTKTAGSTTFTWGTPWQIDGASIAEVSIYRKNSSAGGTGGTYNFVTNNLTAPSLWFVDPPALTADGDTIYRKSGVASGSATQTSASVSYGSAVVYAKRVDGYTPVKGVDYFDGLGGVSVKLQYSVNGSTLWHDTFQTNDKYVRSGTLTPPATTYVYGTATKFVPEKGIEYDDGIDGTNAYLHIAYADTSTGGGFSQSPTNKEYIGTYSDSNPTDSSNAALYSWALIKGADGADGATGSRGAGWWRYETGTTASTAGLSSATVTTYFTTATGLNPVNGDKFVLTNSLNQANAYVYTTSWALQAAFVDGDLLVEGTITSDKINVTSLSAISAELGDVNIDNTLTLTAGGAGFIGGRTSSSQYDVDGFLISRTDKGAGAKGFEVSHTSIVSNQLSGVIHQDSQSMKIFNPTFYTGGSISGGVSNIVNSTVTNIGQTNGEVELTIQGAGGGGGSGKDDGGSTATTATAGGATTVQVRANSSSGPLLASFTAGGGAAGRDAYVNRSANHDGQSTTYGAGGLGGSNRSAGSAPLSGAYGAGGGGGGGDSPDFLDDSGLAGVGGSAGQTIVQSVSTSAFPTSNIYLVTTIGTRGLGSTSNQYSGANGANGVVTYASPLGGTKNYSTDDLLGRVVPRKSFSGTFDPSNTTESTRTVQTGVVSLPSNFYEVELDVDMTLDAQTSYSYTYTVNLIHVRAGVETVLESYSGTAGDNGTRVERSFAGILNLGGSDRFKLVHVYTSSTRARNGEATLSVRAQGPVVNLNYL
jgi:hypothetical protein